MGIVTDILAHPLTRGLSVDDPDTTRLRLEIIRRKPFLKKIYTEWYSDIVSTLPEKNCVLELGSGAGFFSEILPNVITSEVFPVSGVKLIADGCLLPFQDNSLDAIVMTDVFHHIPDVEKFLNEATRCIKPGGKLSMIEPWRTPWAEWIYKNLHSEPFEPNSDWKIPNTGPLSGANGALPWIVFERDKTLFSNKFPGWKIKKIQKIMPISYLVSGGVSMRSLVPGFIYKVIRRIEKITFEPKWAMFALIDLELEK